jgi:hypothetical protein
MVDQDQVLNVYGYREEYVPRRAPQGKLYYIVHPNSEVANRKYLYRLKRNMDARTSQTILAPFRDGCMAFDNIDLASAYCKFVRYLCPNEAHFYVVLEPGNRHSPRKGEMR